MRVASWNLQHLEVYLPGADPDESFSTVADNLQAEVWLFQEVDEFKERSGQRSQTDALSALTGCEFRKFVSTPVIPPEDGDYGIAMCTSIPVKSWHSLSLRRSPIGRRMTFSFNGVPETFYVNDHPRAAVAAVLENGWTVVNTHLSFMPVMAHLHAWQVVRWAKQLAKSNKTELLIGGDFNLSTLWWFKFLGMQRLVTGQTFPANAPDRQIDFLLTLPKSNRRWTSQIGPQEPISDHRWISVELVNP